MANNKDNLSGHSSSNIFVTLYMLPGKIILWLEYMNPKGGFEGVAASRRKAQSPIFTFIAATIFWFFAIFFIFPALFQEGLNTSKSYAIPKESNQRIQKNLNHIKTTETHSLTTTSNPESTKIKILDHKDEANDEFIEKF
jgi:hypothetical protein